MNRYSGKVLAVGTLPFMTLGLPIVVENETLPREPQQQQGCQQESLDLSLLLEESRLLLLQSNCLFGRSMSSLVLELLRHINLFKPGRSLPMLCHGETPNLQWCPSCHPDPFLLSLLWCQTAAKPLTTPALATPPLSPFHCKALNQISLEGRVSGL